MIVFLKLLLIISGVAMAAPVSRVTNFSDGNILTAAQLNNEFNNLISGINSINNDQISASAAIVPSKLSTTIAGDGIARDGSTGVLEVNDDNSTLEVNADVLRVKDNGITDAKIRQGAATSVIGRSAGTAGNVADISTSTNDRVLMRNSSGVLAFEQIQTPQIGNSAVGTNQIGAQAVTTAKIELLGVGSGQLGNGAVTSAKLDSNLNLPGANVAVDSRNIVVSKANASNNLALARGCLNSSGTTIQGEGFSATHPGTGDYVITFTSAFAGVPIFVGTTVEPSGTYVNVVSRTTSVVTVQILAASGGGGSNQAFCFIAIGEH